MSHRCDLVLYALFDLEPVKRFECRSDMRVLRGASDGTKKCILNLLEAFELGDWK